MNRIRMRMNIFHKKYQNNDESSIVEGKNIEYSNKT